MTSWSLVSSVGVVKRNGKLFMVVRSSKRTSRSNTSSSTKDSRSREKGHFTIDANGNASVVTSDHLRDGTTVSKRDSVKSE